MLVLKLTIDMKQYLLDTFNFNDAANKQMLQKIKILPDTEKAIKYFSHLINSQNKWIERIVQNPEALQMNWWEPLYTLDELEEKWNSSLQRWLDYIAVKTEEELHTEVIFTGYDGAKWAATPADIALQLNYHSIHHRAQLQTIVRKQGIEPDFIDYIGTKYRRLG